MKEGNPNKTKEQASQPHYNRCPAHGSASRASCVHSCVQSSALSVSPIKRVSHPFSFAFPPKTARSDVTPLKKEDEDERHEHTETTVHGALIIQTVRHRERNPSTARARRPVHYAKGALSSRRGRARRKRYVRAHYRAIHRGICIRHKARDGARRCAPRSAPAGRGHTEPSPGPIRALLGDGPRGRLCPIGPPWYDTALCPTSMPHREHL